MSAKAYGAIAVTNIIFCCLLALAILMPASMGGFNAIAIGTYVALILSIAASFYLLAKRRELEPSALRQLAGVIAAATLLATTPLVVGLIYALFS